jgi:hypothetical protein
LHDFSLLIIAQDLPPALTLLPKIAEPPFCFGKLIFMVKSTFPSLTEDDEIAIISGASGLLTLAWALGALVRVNKTEVARA